ALGLSCGHSVGRCAPGYGLALLRRYAADSRSELCMCAGINRPMPDRGTCGVGAKTVVIFPVLRRSDGSGRKATTAIGTDVSQHRLNAGGAKRAFIATNACLQRIGGQRLVAVFAGWTEFKHRIFPVGRRTLASAPHSGAGAD